MAIYQIKVRGKKGIHRYDTFVQADVEETINMAPAEEERIKKELGDKFEPREIEQVTLLCETEDPDKAVKQIWNELSETFRDLRNLGDIGIYAVSNRTSNVWELWSLMDSIENKAERIHSLLKAFWDITENKESDFYATKARESEG